MTVRRCCGGAPCRCQYVCVCVCTFVCERERERESTYTSRYACMRICEYAYTTIGRQSHTQDLMSTLEPIPSYTHTSGLSLKKYKTVYTHKVFMHATLSQMCRKYTYQYTHALTSPVNPRNSLLGTPPSKSSTKTTDSHSESTQVGP